MLERDLTKYLTVRCKEAGILADKFTSLSGRAKPDWLLTYGRMVLVELKAPGKLPTEAQKRDHLRRRDRGVEVVWTDSIEGVEAILQHMLAGAELREYKY